MSTDIFNYSLSELDYLTNISVKNRYLYLETPKVACTTIKNSLHYYEMGNTHSSTDGIHNKKISPLKGLTDSGLTFEQAFYGNDFYRFAFVRNPYPRILSCYLNKIIGNSVAYGMVEREHFRKQLGLEKDDDITFLDFLEAVEKQSMKEMNIHWRPQSSILCDDKVHFHYIGHFEYFERDFSYVLVKIGGKAEMLQTWANHSTHAADKIREFFGKKEIRIIQDVYGLDFLRYGYSLLPNI